MNAPNSSMYMYDCGTKPVYTWIKSPLKLKFNAFWFLQDFLNYSCKKSIDLKKYLVKKDKSALLFQKKFHPIMQAVCIYVYIQSHHDIALTFKTPLQKRYWHHACLELKVKKKCKFCLPELRATQCMNRYSMG